MNQNNKFELSQQYNRKWQPYRNASRFVPLEATQNQIAWTAIGPAAEVDAHPQPEHDVRCRLQPLRLLVARLRLDRRRAGRWT